MNVMWKAACAAALIAAAAIEIGCGETYRPVASPLPVTTGNPSGPETEVVLNQCTISGVGACLGIGGNTGGSNVTDINVSGDTNSGDKTLNNVVGSPAYNPVTGFLAIPAAPVPSIPMAFDANRGTVYTANTASDSVTRVLISNSTSGFAANTTTISLDAGAAPTAVSFQYFGNSYTLDYVVNSGKTLRCPLGGSLSVINQSSVTLQTAVCLGVANPVFAWIYTDQSKVFVLDQSAGKIYVVSASKFEVTNTIAVPAPFKATQSSGTSSGQINGQFVFVLNGGNAPTISIINGLTETVVGSAAPTSTSPFVDIVQDVTFNRIWTLQRDGTVSEFDANTPGVLTLINSVPTITAAQLLAGVYPTNLALLADGTQAYVGLGNTDTIVAIDPSKISSLPNVPPSNATTTIIVGVHHGTLDATGTWQPATQTLTSGTASATVPVELTLPTVNYVAVSRGGDSADLFKAYASTTTNTTYYCYDDTVTAAPCGSTNSFWDGGAAYVVPGCTASTTNPNTMSCPNLYNGTAVVTGVGNGSTPINTYVTTVPAPMVVPYCNPGTANEYDGQKNCPAMAPVGVLGRS